ncbi:hypothetical protein [Deinococcus sp.]|uniref:hypothetical protein n=1 Tax=Deinococcus sp. TaxID=47478 RepID=UPI0025B90D60|nr:hypothetical protein [Deinococcus sp.]
MHTRAEQATAKRKGTGRRTEKQRATGNRARLGVAALPALLLALAGTGSAGSQGAPSCGGTPGVPGWARTATYRGTLGTLPIALQLTPGRFGSRYFYERRSLDIFLEEFRSGEQLILQESVGQTLSSNSVTTGCFTLSPVQGGLKGTWQAPGGRAAPVTLKAVNALTLPLNLPSSPGLQRLRRDDPLAFLKLNRPWVRTASSVREPLSGLHYPRVPGASAPLNAALQDRLLKNAVSALDCRSMLPPDRQSSDDAGYQLQAAVTLQRPHLLSLREDVYYECGGAHPDYYSVGLILDRATGREVNPATIWPTLTASRQETLYLSGVRRQVEASCLDVLTQSSLDFTANLTPAGLNLTPTSLPHVFAGCDETVVVPYATLRPDANTASPYFPDLYVR